jgi:formylmethanofuran dehydrogenase subunit E
MQHHQPVAILREESARFQRGFDVSMADTGALEQSVDPENVEDHAVQRCDQCGERILVHQGWFLSDSFICERHLWLECTEG